MELNGSLWIAAEMSNAFMNIIILSAEFIVRPSWVIKISNLREICGVSKTYC